VPAAPGGRSYQHSSMARRGHLSRAGGGGRRILRAPCCRDHHGARARDPLSGTTRQTIRLERDQLVADRPGRPLQLLLPETGDVFFTPGRPRIRRIFTRAPDGQVRGFAERREGTDLLWTRVAEDAAH